MKRTLRRLGYTFRRARRVPPEEPSPQAQARVKKALIKLHALETAGKCAVLYTDESGFCLQPCVPYLWQKKGQTAGLASQAHSKRLSVLGFLHRQTGSLHRFSFNERLTAQHLIDSVEDLLSRLDKPTVLVLDNASIHRAKVVQQKRAQWKKRGLRLLFLPPQQLGTSMPYCPHLNCIEILWRTIKYRWLAPQDYSDFAALRQAVTNILDNVGTKYRISFA